MAFLFVSEGFDPGKFFAFQKFEGGATTSRDMCDPVCHTRLLDGGNRVSATDDGDSTGIIRNGLGDLHRSDGERFDFEDTHGAVPDDGAGGIDLLAECRDGLWSDIESHHVVGY